MNESQIGFLSKMSFSQAVAKVTEFYVSKTMIKRLEKPVSLISKKRLTHSTMIFLGKLENYGFRGKITELLRIFLSDREQNEA